MRDRVLVRRGGAARRVSREERALMSDPTRKPQRHAAAQTRGLAEIVHAQYHRELKRAMEREPPERAGALAEARRLLAVAVALRNSVARQDVSATPAGPARRRDPQSGHPQRPELNEESKRLRR